VTHRYGRRQRVERQIPTLKLLGDKVIFGANLLLAVDPIEAAHREMPPGDVLEMLDECVIHRSAAESAR
jgi:hypothetical protein